MGPRHMRDVLGNYFKKDQLFHLVHWLSITLFLRKTSQESINLERKSYLDCSSDTLCTRGEFGRVTWLVADPEELETMDASEIYSKRLDAKEVIFPQDNGEFKKTIEDGRIKTLLEEIRNWEHPLWYGTDPIQGESQSHDLLGESQGSLSPPQDSYPDAGEAINDFWSMSWSFIYRHHVEPRVKLYSPGEESFPIPLQYIDVSRTTHTNLDVFQESRIDDFWNIDGSRDLSDPWTGFTQYTLLEEKAPDGYMWSGERLTKRLSVIQAWSFVARTLGRINGKETPSWRRRQKWSDEKLKSWKRSENCEGSISSTLRIRNFKDTIKNARKKLDTSVAPVLCPVKSCKKSIAWGDW